MNARTRTISSCLAVGILVLILAALSGFWARWICTDTLGGLMRGTYRGTRVSPLGLLPNEIENDPNVVAHSEAVLRPGTRTSAPWGAGLGAFDYFDRLKPWSGPSDILVWQAQGDGMWLYYDRKLDLVVYSKVERVPARNGEPRRIERVWLYAGPEGMAETPDEALGRFQSPVLSPQASLLYDAQQRRFFTLDFLEERTVVKGPEIDPNENHEPVQIGAIGKRPDMFSWAIESPGREKDPNEPEVSAGRFGHVVQRGGIDVVPTIPLLALSWSSPYVFVLDASGRIDLLDKQTLEFSGSAGALPAVDELFGRPRMPARPRSLFAYDMRPVLRPIDRVPSRWEYEYLGCVAGAYNRDGTCMTLATFDKQGSRANLNTSWTVSYDAVPGAPLATTTRFLLENLHPPALLLLSYFRAPYDEAGAGYRSLLVVPDSFVAKKGRNLGQIFALRFVGALALMAPAIILAAILAVLVGKNAQKIGFSKDARTLWILITVAFGLPAYITYRLTTAGTTLVTCSNCGLARRPDMDRCHRCNSPWEVPELNPPAWRVLDGGRRDLEGPPMLTEDVAVE